MLNSTTSYYDAHMQCDANALAGGYQQRSSGLNGYNNITAVHVQTYVSMFQIDGYTLLSVLQTKYHARR